jgi:FlaA1/EpsC-like NDP-sugar epimerase
MLAQILVRGTALSRPVKRFLQVMFDCALIAACLALAMALRTDGFSALSDAQVWIVLLPVLPLTITAFIKLGLYRAVIRYITVRALRVVLLGVTLSAAVMAASTALFGLPVPGTVPVIYALLLFLCVGGIRFMARAVFQHDKVRHRKPLLIYGAGEAGRQLANALHQDTEYDPIAFIDDDRTLHGSTVAGLRVWPRSRLPELIADTQARTILLALPSIGRARRREIIAALEPLGVEVKSIPGMADIVGDKARFQDVRVVTPEDLLGRDPIAPRDGLMGAHLTGKVVLVSGAGGSIGSELCRQILSRNPRSLLLLDVSEYALYRINEQLRQMQTEGIGPSTWVVPVLGSVQNENRMRAVLHAYAVQTIYHAAAFKHVPLVEENMVEGVRNNVFGTRTLAEAAVATGVANFILVSTDKAVRPANVMGATKRLAELICQGLARSQTRTTFSMVRFGNVLGSSGSVIPRFRQQIERGGPVTVTHRDITRYFMTITEAAQLVIQAGAMARGGDVFVLDMGEPVRVFDLARSMIRLHGLEPYVIEPGEGPNPGRGDIGIHVTGLRKGEKLFEELLIGTDPAGTDHPRIMTARETWMDPQDLDRLLARMLTACQDYDIPLLRDLLIEAPLGYSPADDQIADLAWHAAQSRGTLPGKATLRLIDGARRVAEQG